MSNNNKDNNFPDYLIDEIDTTSTIKDIYKTEKFIRN